MSARLAFVVVTYNTRALLQGCLRRLQEERASLRVPCRIIVVDNASSDGTVELVRDEFPHVSLIQNAENLGPARALNQGIAEALRDADLVMVMNSDVSVLPGAVSAMLAFMEANPDVDGVSGPLYWPDMTPQKTRTHIARILPSRKNGPFREDFVGTTCAMIRSDTYRRVGGYDESYYFFNEDLDWAERARRLGCSFFHLPAAGAVHASGGGRRQNVARIMAELYRANIYFFLRHHPLLAWIALIALRIEISGKVRRLRRALVRTRESERRRELSEAIATYVEARLRMEAEYRRQTPPRIPSFAGG